MQPFRLQPFQSVRSHTVVLASRDIDTDQIIPARFLKTTGREGLGRWLFADWRYDAAGEPREDFALNRPEARGARVLVAGANFGCGSSREHAPWALADWGFRAVVSSSIADIFASNALKNGLLPVRVDPVLHARLLEAPGMRVAVDLERCVLTLEDGTEAHFPVDPFARHCLLHGVDALGYLLAHAADISRFEDRSRAEEGRP